MNDDTFLESVKECSLRNVVDHMDSMGVRDEWRHLKQIISNLSQARPLKLV